MGLQQKYQEAINLAQQLGAQNLRVQEENGVLKIWANVQTEQQKAQIWDKIKYIGGQQPGDLIADINSLNPGGATGTEYTVQPGDTLSKIAKQHLGDANSYMTIFNANKNILNDPDKIQPGQKLIIPKQ